MGSPFPSFIIGLSRRSNTPATCCLEDILYCPLEAFLFVAQFSLACVLSDHEREEERNGRRFAIGRLVPHLEAGVCGPTSVVSQTTEPFVYECEQHLVRFMLLYSDYENEQRVRKKEFK